MAQVVDDSLEAGREAAQRRAWRDAYDLLKDADEAGRLAAEDLESFGEAAWWTGRLDEAIGLRERAYAAFVAAGEPRRAAMMTVSLAMDYGLRGALSVSGRLDRPRRATARRRARGRGARVPLAHSRHQRMLDLGELGRAGEAFRPGARAGERATATAAVADDGPRLRGSRSRVWTGGRDGGARACSTRRRPRRSRGGARAHGTGRVDSVTIELLPGDLGDYRRADGVDGGREPMVRPASTSTASREPATASTARR